MTDTQPNGVLRTMPLAKISVAEGFNPRSEFERRELDRLAESIGRDGLLQPLVVTEDGDGCRLIAGERRYRAAQQAGLAEVPVVVRELAGDGDDLALALVENIAREELTPAFSLRTIAQALRRGRGERRAILRKAGTVARNEARRRRAAGRAPAESVRRPT